MVTMIRVLMMLKARTVMIQAEDDKSSPFLDFHPGEQVGIQFPPMPDRFVGRVRVLHGSFCVFSCLIEIVQFDPDAADILSQLEEFLCRRQGNIGRLS